jgi:16S rRNA (cytosine967-C5)-methyltransferase
MRISPSRTSAFDILFHIETENAYSSVLLPHETENLSDVDRGLCYELVLGTLRRQIFLDEVIRHLAGKKKLDIEVRIALRLGLYQIGYLDRVPPHAAINECVNLVVRARKVSAKGFVNAILRRASLGFPTLDPSDAIEATAIESSHPKWLVEKWTSDFGPERAAEICKANNQVIPPAFRMTERFYAKFGRDKRSAETVASALGISATDVRASTTIGGCFYADRISQEIHSAAEAGLIYFQDAGSQLVAAATTIPENGRFLDLCASPGGKVTSITSDLGKSAALIVAADLSSPRVSNLMLNCERQGLSVIKIMQIDATRDLPFVPGSFDMVLVDAPCTGTGTIRHNPEIRYRVSADDISTKQSKQRAILESASKAIRAGGSLIYATCSLEQEENEDVAEDFVARNPEFVVVKPNVPLKFLVQDRFARTFPSDFEGDGFFIASFERKSA